MVIPSWGHRGVKWVRDMVDKENIQKGKNVRVLKGDYDLDKKGVKRIFQVEEKHGKKYKGIRFHKIFETPFWWWELWVGAEPHPQPPSPFPYFHFEQANLQSTLMPCFIHRKLILLWTRKRKGNPWVCSRIWNLAKEPFCVSCKNLRISAFNTWVQMNLIVFWQFIMDEETFSVYEAAVDCLNLRLQFQIKLYFRLMSLMFKW